MTQKKVWGGKSHEPGGNEPFETKKEMGATKAREKTINVPVYHDGDAKTALKCGR